MVYFNWRKFVRNSDNEPKAIEYCVPSKNTMARTNAKMSFIMWCSLEDWPTLDVEHVEEGEALDRYQRHSGSGAWVHEL